MFITYSHMEHVDDPNLKTNKGIQFVHEGEVCGSETTAHI
jgi:hypothetical protein